MDRSVVYEYVKRKYKCEPEYPWSDSNAVLRHKDSRKWFALFMDVRRSYLKLDGEGTVEVLNLKCDPMLITSLLNEKGFLPAYHMSKLHWISVLLDGTVPDGKVFSLLDLSYALTE